MNSGFPACIRCGTVGCRIECRAVHYGCPLHIFICPTKLFSLFSNLVKCVLTFLYSLCKHFARSGVKNLFHFHYKLAAVCCWESRSSFSSFIWNLNLLCGRRTSARRLTLREREYGLRVISRKHWQIALWRNSFVECSNVFEWNKIFRWHEQGLAELSITLEPPFGAINNKLKTVKWTHQGLDLMLTAPGTRSRLTCHRNRESDRSALSQECIGSCRKKTRQHHILSIIDKRLKWHSNSRR